MAHLIEHAKSSAHRFRGRPEDIWKQSIHDWFDESATKSRSAWIY